MFVAALVLSYCMNLPVLNDPVWQHVDADGSTKNYYHTDADIRRPYKEEILSRLAWAEPLALITTVLAIQAVRKIWRSIPHKAQH
jgi:hypothetical protein